MARFVSGYIRVSSAGQDLASQRHAIETAAAARGEKIDRWYEEKASAKVLERPAMQEMRRDLSHGLLARVYVHRLDRCVRSGLTDAARLVGEFRSSGTELLAVADGLHIKPGADDITSEVLVFALSLCSRLERSALLDRQAAARAAMRAAGRAWGRPPKARQEQREKVIALWKSSYSVRRIAMNVHLTKTTCQRIIEAYRKSPSDLSLRSP